MNPQSHFTRRHFLGTAAAATVAGLLGPGISTSRAATATGETKHFWYRLAPEGPYIDSQRGSKAFGFGDGKIFLSEDNAKTWAHSAPFPEAENITLSVILKNGNLLFATREKLFLSTDNLATHRQIVVKNRDGRDYLPHTPQNSELPGWYFHSLDGIHTWDIDGAEMLVWGNYCNVVGGPVPVNIYYSTDSGQTVKIAYSFGRNPKFQEKGAEPAAFLGDPENKLICRHVHAVAYHPAERAFYACTGDIDRGLGNECHWLRGTYDAKADKWDWRVIVSVNSNSRFKSGGINFVDGQLYWAADANGPKPPNEKHDRGIFRCAPADLADPTKHTKLFNAEFEMANMIIEDGVILAGHCAPASTFATGIAVSNDMGRTWAEYDLKEFGPRSPCRFHPKNSDGWFRVDLRKKWIDRGEVLFIKPKP
ncbi:MAG: twin-arginine translocation signal domain-containing protein [Chthoniobacteraceae bacterium]